MECLCEAIAPRLSVHRAIQVRVNRVVVQVQHVEVQVALFGRVVRMNTKGALVIRLPGPRLRFD